jgi:hypothetical protein
VQLSRFKKSQIKKSPGWRRSAGSARGALLSDVIKGSTRWAARILRIWCRSAGHGFTGALRAELEII